MPKILLIVKHPDSMVHTKTKLVDLNDLATDKMQQLIDNMIATMWHADGIGIAAPQVGVGLRLCIVTNGKEAIPLINPKITKRSLRRETMEEGCLSVPGYYGPVRRAIRLDLKAFDRMGQPIAFSAEGLPARIVQHELDHLDGTLFIDRSKNVQRVDSSGL